VTPPEDPAGSARRDSTSGSGPRIHDVTAQAYRYPTLRPEADGTLSWDATTLVVVRLALDAGDIEGLGWTYADVSCVPVINNVLAGAIRDRPILDMPAAWHAMQRQIRNLGRPGIVSTALSAVDIAIWDAAARWLGLPLSRLLGRCHEKVAVYGSGGFTSETEQQLTDELIMWSQQRSMPRVKIKIGESWGQAVDRDKSRIQLARQVIGDRTTLYVDANGGYTVGQAKRMARYLDDQGVEWFEEPVSSDDLAGLEMIRSSCRADVAAGEYGYDLAYFGRMLPVVDCIQVDVTRCGGYTEWMRIAAAAAAHGRDVSAHCAPNLSVHCAAATPNFRHIEWFFDHDRLESELFDGTVDPSDGYAEPRLTAGHGLSLRTEAAQEYAVDV
jgi:L-alanine-DL-glutamate epimerase-like enolase superfamily enzyme